MPKIKYISKRFAKSSRLLMAQAQEIVSEYEQQGYDLTLRQLYYQFVSRDYLANKQTEYKRLGSLISDARLAGFIDWDSITDRTRNLHSLPSWASPGEIIASCANQYRTDLWANQPCRVEVSVEKEALSGVFQRICDELRLPMFACRGYCSQSEMWVAAQRLNRYRRAGQQPIILHFGDHDPSGMDMTRDIVDRLAILNCPLRLERLALNMDQVEQYDPPPNPAKMTDCRAEGYVAEFGESSWELDALEPAVLSDLVSSYVAELRDDRAWGEAAAVEAMGRDKLREISNRETESE